MVIKKTPVRTLVKRARARAKKVRKNPVKKYFKGKGKQVLSKMEKEYGKKGGKRVFYATARKLGLTANPSYILKDSGYWFPSSTLRGEAKKLPSYIGVSVEQRKKSVRGDRWLLSTTYEGKTWFGWFDKDQIERSNPSNEAEQSLSLTESSGFAVTKVDLTTQQQSVIAPGVCAEEAKVIASALQQNCGAGSYFNVQPSEMVSIREEENPTEVEDLQLRILKLQNKALRQMASSPKQKETIAEYKKLQQRLASIGGKEYHKLTNPSQAVVSEEMFRTFHGSEPKKVTVFETDIYSHDSYWKLGDLVSFITIGDDGVERESFLPSPDGPKDDVVSLAASPNGKQLYLIGGDQEFDLKSFGLKGHQASKDVICLGRLKNLTYRTAKEMHDFEIIDYTHQSGENLDESGKRFLSNDALPYLNYDRLNKALSVAGGAYFITERGIEN